MSLFLGSTAKKYSQRALVITQPYLIDDVEVVVTGSIGITLFPEDSEDQESIVKNADAAMYQAKSAGKNAYRFYSADAENF